MDTHQTSSSSDDSEWRLAYRPVEAAEALRISPRKLWELTADRSSGIPVVRLGRSVRYPVDDLRRWLSERARDGQGVGR
jgi:excisionase family DNA binding protein